MRNTLNNATADTHVLPVIGTDDVVRETFSVRKSHMWYAFASDSLMPGATKIGDTTRDVPTRVDEWRAEFPDARILASGSTEVLPGIFVRDHSIHKGCVDRGYHQLQAEDFTDGKQHTTEAYDVTPKVAPKLIAEIIDDIRHSHGVPGSRYTYYSVDSDKKQIGLEHYPRDPFNWTLRPIQLEAVDNSENAVMMGIDTMLLDASVRFGKCLTTLSIAERLGLKRILVTSGKADVEEEWKKAVEIPGQFKGWGFVSPDLLRTSDTILDEMEKEYDVIVVFMTLQDSWNAEDKRRYAQILSRKWDLLAVDETHYGARAEKFRQAIDGVSRSYTLHLSGSPFRILASQEFSPEQIVACKTRADMIAEREAWDEAHADEVASGAVAPWANPYYGIPTPVTMALLGDDETTAKIRALSEDGITINFRELFATNHDPQSPKFVHEAEIRSLLEMIDDRDETLGFLSFDIASRNDLFRHMVWCLPERDSCDAMEDLLGKMIEEGRFQHLVDYVTVNVAGNHAPKEYQVPGGTRQVVRDIAQTAANGDKTISLTVYRMLTGVTVPEWDTMLMLTNTENAEFYEQATGRLMSPFTQTVVNEDDASDSYKVNRKPYVVIVDFDPARVFRIAEQRSIAQRITGKGIDEAVAHEMRYAPIITANADGFKRVTPTDLRKAISRYSTAGIADEVQNIPVDSGMLADWDFINAIRDFHENSLGRREIEVDPFEEQGDALDIPETKIDDESDITEDDVTVDGTDDKATDGHGEDKKQEDKESEKARKALVDKIRDFYFRSVAFAAAWQAGGVIKTLEDVRIKAKTTKTGRTIAKNLGILDDIDTLCDAVGKFPNISLRLDSAIYNISTLVNDEELSGMEKARILMERFGRLSSSEVATPAWVAQKIIETIPDEAFQKDEPRFLDLASKVGEMAYAIVNRCGRMGKTPEVRSVTTSNIAYVLTVAIYRLMGLNPKQVAKFRSYDLLGKDIKTMAKTLRQDKDFYQIDLFDLLDGEVEDDATSEEADLPTEDTVTHSSSFGIIDFDAVVANPPYQQGLGNTRGNKGKAKAIYHLFVSVAVATDASYVSMITPSRWMIRSVEGIPSSWIDEMLNGRHIRIMHDYTDSTLCFPGIDIKGGVSIFMYDNAEQGECQYNVYYGDEQHTTRVGELDEFKAGIVIRDAHASDIIRKISEQVGYGYQTGDKSFATIVSPKDFFTNKQVLTSSWRGYSPTQTEETPIKYFLNKKMDARGIGYISLDVIPKNPGAVAKNKVLIPAAAGSGNDSQILGRPILAEAPSACSQTYLVIGYNRDFSLEECRHIMAYLMTRFARYLVSIKKRTQNGPRAVYQFVPIQDFTSDSDIDWSKSIDEIDEQLFDRYDLTDDERIVIRERVAAMSVS